MKCLYHSTIQSLRNIKNDHNIKKKFLQNTVCLFFTECQCHNITPPVCTVVGILTHSAFLLTCMHATSLSNLLISYKKVSCKLSS